MSETAIAQEIPKAYEPGSVEEKWYARWEESGCFRGDEASDREPYSIVIPPPNVTGILHLGHVLNNTIQDILARRARMQGKAVLWLPGTDHAGIATQSKVEQQLRKEQGKTRRDLGREAFLDLVWEWKDKHGGIIINQLKKLGCSCDWERERFTMDAEYSKWISKIFVDLFKQGLIYRGKRMVNWCPKSLTALSDEEVIMKPQRSKLYTMRYELADEPGRYVEIATTRPETLMGDTAVAVNPKDPRYADLLGRKVRRPFPEAEIPVVADDHIDPEFGTGVLKVTPAHDKADFDIGLRHGLPVIDVFNPDGTLNAHAGPEFEGMDRFEAREKAAAKLDEMGLLVKVEEYENNVGFSERADVPIEPRLSMQWFLKYPCVPEATEAVESDAISFRPIRWKKTYLHWMENIQDWCISRQLWWGHRIPAWYNDKALARLEEEVPVVECGNPIEGGSAKELRANAVKAARELGIIGGTFTNEDRSLPVAVYLRSITKVGGNRGLQNLQAVPAIPELIRTAKHIGSYYDRRSVSDCLAVHRFVGAVSMGGDLYRATLTIKEFTYGATQYDHRLTKIKKPDGKSPDPSLRGESGDRPASGFGVKIADLFGDVNMNPAFVQASETAPGEGWRQDDDVLDTWFSSWLWPFATMADSDKPASAALKKFYPTSDLVTGPDILFFWVARMIMAGFRWQGELPFRNVFYTSIIRDKFGRKLSKSLGNSPDPLDIIATLGADALRFAIMRIAPIGSDVRFIEERGKANTPKEFDATESSSEHHFPQVEEGRNFANKLWNAARFRQMQGDAGAEAGDLPIYAIDVLAKLAAMEENLDRAYGEYRFNEIAQILYDFFWSEYCDWYLESIKRDVGRDATPEQKAAAIRTQDAVLRRFLMHLHPYMPHITEELWQSLGFAEGGEFLMRTVLPEASPVADLAPERVGEAQAQVAAIYSAVGRARNLKAEYNLAANKNVKFIVKPAAGWVEGELGALALLSGASEAAADAAYDPPKGTPAAVTDIGEIYMPLEGLIDIEAEKARLSKELAKVEGEIKKCNGKLNNANFVERAKPEVVDQERQRRDEWEVRRDQIKAMLENLG